MVRSVTVATIPQTQQKIATGTQLVSDGPARAAAIVGANPAQCEAELRADGHKFDGAHLGRADSRLREGLICGEVARVHGALILGLAVTPYFLAERSVASPREMVRSFGIALFTRY
jgi:hypothetical protein